MRNILVTGATGRLGANLVKALAETGHKVRGLVMPRDPKLGKVAKLDVEIIQGDITDPDAVNKAVAGMDAVIHTAAIMENAPPGMTRQTFFDINVHGTFNVLEAMREHRRIARKLVYLSSTAAYDVQSSPGVLREDQPAHPTHLYGVTKIVNERMTLAYQFMEGFDVTALRPNWIMTGDEILDVWTVGGITDCLKRGGNDPRMSFCAKVKEPWKPLEKLRVPLDTMLIPRGANGLPWRTHCTDVRDAVQGCILALEKKQSAGQVFNICGAEPADHDKVVRYIAKRTGRPYVECKLPCLWRFCCDNGKARRLLGYRPKYGIKEMVDCALAFRAGKDTGVIPA